MAGHLSLSAAEAVAVEAADTAGLAMVDQHLIAGRGFGRRVSEMSDCTPLLSTQSRS